MNRKFLFIILLALPVFMQAAEVSIVRLRAEQMTDPLGLDTATPRLSWQLTSDGQNIMQTAYHILVASSPELLSQDKGDLWDSGVVESDESQWIVYQGEKLGSGTYAYWKVKSYTTGGETQWSEPALWSVGLLKEAHWKGIWVGYDDLAPGDYEAERTRLSARYLRKEFSLEKPVKRATIYIAGLGLYELYVNGEQLGGNQVLAPTPTDYRKTIVYNTFDVTSLLSSDNAIGVALGNGHFFSPRMKKNPAREVTFGYPKLRLNLVVEYADGTTETIVSDISWKLTTNGPIRSNNEYDGEEYDARMELGDWTRAGYDDSEWEPARRVGYPSGTLRGISMPNMNIQQTLSPVSINKVDDKYILDMGQNLTGWVRMKVKGAEGDTIRLRFAETLQDDGNLYMENLRTALVTDTYICNGKEDGTEWAPRFVYHGFRYVEVSGYDQPQTGDFVAEMIGDDMETIGSFSCSNELLTRIHKNASWGIMGNYKGFPMDCPQRDERQAWTGDHAMGLWGESYIYDNDLLYAKWSRDLCESQREDGCLPDVAPTFWHFYTDNLTWPFALPSACDMLYVQFGNTEAMEHSYANIKKWTEYFREEHMTEDYIVTKDTYGDWCVPPEGPTITNSRDPSRATDSSLIATAYMVKLMQLQHRFAEILGYEDDMREYEALEARLTEAFNNKFLHTGEEVYYGNNTVTANLLPLAFGIVPEEYVDDLVGSIVSTIMVKNDGHISCGVIGVQWLMRELSRRGHSDVAWLLATNDTYPSWGYMVKKGATTIWELWNGDTANPSMNSGNHVMLLGDLIPWCYENVGGIRSDRAIGKTGYKHIILQPEFGIEGLDNADVSYMTPYGKVASKWTKTKKWVEWDIDVPANTTAQVHLPDGKVEEVGSGHYYYKVKL